MKPEPAESKLHSTGEREEGVVIGVTTRSIPKGILEEYLDELVLLADTAGVTVVHKFSQDRNSVDRSTYIGSGKAGEIAGVVEREKIRVAIFDDDLSPVQVRNLEKQLKCKILDRSGLILDIFAGRARTKEAMTQVELAQLQYRLPRLTRQWTHLSKQYGGVGTKGPGETQIETDRRAIRTRIGHLKEKLTGISREREVQRRGREGLTRVAMVGYTNAGKSTLFRAMTGADVLIEDRLFATLDTTVRKITPGQGKNILLSDTVGFIRKLPAHLVASFRSTLSEVVEADLLLHVVDASHAHADEQIETVNETLASLGADKKPVLIVFNKIDRLADRSRITEFAGKFPGSVFISAERNINLTGLTEKMMGMIDSDSVERTLTFRQSEYNLISKLHDIGELLGTKYTGDRIRVRCRVPRKNEEQLQKLLARSIDSNELNFKTDDGD
ncbi:MAG TPA: GTPase HflX [Bacteroidota bacterium]|nr:GTPase HflX [Bacteroidota bacterium]